MEDLHIVSDWKDKMLGDLKQFSEKKHKPVGMHHLINDISSFANPNNLIEISFAKFSNDFIKPSLLERLENSDNKVMKKLPIKISTLLKKENKFNKELKSIIIYAIPVPKSIFKYSVEDISNYFKLLKIEKSKIDNMLLHALSKYGYWGISEDLHKEYLSNSFDKNKIFEASHLGEIAPNGFPVTVKNGPRILVSYMVTNAPLKTELDRPVDICNEDCVKASRDSSLNHIKYYKDTFGLKKSVVDTMKSIVKNNKFGEYIDFCYNCELGNEFEINLLVKDPLDYKK